MKNKNERINAEIKKLKTKDFNVFFYIMDAKNNATGYVSYIYQMAKGLEDIGYNVTMLYQGNEGEEPFEGVGLALGSDFAELKHKDINGTEFSVSPSDFLFIPEVFSNLMNQTKKLPCKRIAIMQNYDYLTDFIPVGMSWANFGITDAITTTQNNSTLLSSVFPYVKQEMLEPYIPEYFNDEGAPKKMIVNLLVKNPKDVNKITKTFYWQYPMYKWVTFNDVRGVIREKAAEQLKDGAITVWCDSDSQFGYNALEAMRCGNVVIGKIPELTPSWMLGEDGETLRDNGIWVNDINNIPRIIASVVRTWINDDIPEQVLSEMDKTNKLYTHSDFARKLEDIMDRYVKGRIKEFEEVKTALNGGQNGK